MTDTMAVDHGLLVVPLQQQEQRLALPLAPETRGWERSSSTHARYRAGHGMSEDAQ
jgi:hypothetical protein